MNADGRDGDAGGREFSDILNDAGGEPGAVLEPGQCLECAHSFRPLLDRLMPGKQAVLCCNIRDIQHCTTKNGVQSLEYYEKAPCHLVNITEDCDLFEKKG